MSKVPVFEYYPDTSEIPLRLPDGGNITIEINPGWAFGKGFHPTTKLCINALEKLFAEHESGSEKIETVLDVGCGTGVLTISAAALGAGKVIGIDIDNTIVLEARSNLEKNGVFGKADVILGSIEDARGLFDLIVANILAGSILAISGQFEEKLKPGGLLLLSGIKDGEKAQVIERFNELGFSRMGESAEKGWVSLIFRL
ncbi:MAG: 50S ribosomal protein L11 methyltransferase [Deltaproteobacteria bacterium]